MKHYQPRELNSCQASISRGEAVKRRVLRVACEAFAQAGYSGTHIRQICKLARVNVAAVCYYFRDKEGLFEAVQSEARARLAQRSILSATTPEERLQEALRSLVTRLSGEFNWIARLLAREWATLKGTEAVCEELRTDLVRIESSLRDAAGPAASPGTIRLEAFNLLTQCVFYSVDDGSAHRICPELDKEVSDPPVLARHLSRLSLAGIA